VTHPYRRLGWEVAGTLHFRQLAPPALAAIPPASLAVRWARDADRAVVRAGYDRGRTNGFLDRPDGRWQWWLERFADDHLFVAGDDGYVLYRVVDEPPAGPEGFRLVVLDLVAATPDAWRALWGMLRWAAPIVPRIFVRGGPSDPLLHVLDTLALTPVRERPWMLRLVDAAAAIAARGYPAGVRAAVELEIADDDCPWNAGRVRLVVDDGTGRLEPGGAGAVRLAIGALAALYSGWATTASLAQAGLLDGADAAACATLDRVFAGPLPGCSTNSSRAACNEADAWTPISRTDVTALASPR
jgi:predicted acetyltransferase